MRNILLAEVISNPNGLNAYSYNRERRMNMLNETNISVYAPYEIIENDGEKYIVATSCRDKFNKRAYKKGDVSILLDCVNRHSHRISPFEVENLFLEAYKINLEDEQSILNFCNRFGVMGELSQKNTFNDEFMDFMDLWGPFESLEFFKKEISEFQECLDLYNMTEIQDEDKLGKLWRAALQKDIEQMKQGLLKMKNDNALNQHIEAYYIALKTFDREKTRIENDIKYLPAKDEILKEIKTRLVEKMNERMPNVFYNLQVSPNGEFVQGITSFNLLGSVYYQLYQNVIKGSKFKECEYCGNIFGPLKKSDMRFCPNDSDEPVQTKHSKCENRYSAMVKRVRTWAKEEKTPEEIHQKIRKPKKRSLEEIKRWIETDPSKKT